MGKFVGVVEVLGKGGMLLVMMEAGCGGGEQGFCCVSDVLQCDLCMVRGEGVGLGVQGCFCVACDWNCGGFWL